MHDRLSEFDLIEKYFKPLASAESGAGELANDAAVLSPKEGHHLVVTMDTLVSGVHFFEFTPPDFIAAKSLRVNLSDLAAMGAEPAWYTLSLSLPNAADGIYGDNWLDSFAQALQVEQTHYGITLVGGDTVSTPGPLSLSITAMGWVKTGQAMKRSSARPGDIIYVSGAIGDATLGLAVIHGKFSELESSSLEILTERHNRPRPRLDLGQRLFGLASAAIDISDGLVQDLGHICLSSKVTATIHADNIPLSAVGQSITEIYPEMTGMMISGGDDYELLFCVPTERQQAVASLAEELNLSLTPIGVVDTLSVGKPVKVLNREGQELKIPTTGYRHI